MNKESPQWTWRDSLALVITVPLTYFIAPQANRILTVDPNWIIVSWIVTAFFTFLVVSLIVGGKNACVPLGRCRA